MFSKLLSLIFLLTFKNINFLIVHHINKMDNSITLTKKQIEHLQSLDKPPSTDNKDYLRLLKELSGFVKDYNGGNKDTNSDYYYDNYPYLFNDHFSIVKILSENEDNFYDNLLKITNTIESLALAKYGSIDFNDVKNNYQKFMDSNFSMTGSSKQ